MDSLADRPSRSHLRPVTRIVSPRVVVPPLPSPQANDSIPRIEEDGPERQSGIRHRRGRNRQYRLYRSAILDPQVVG